MIKLTFSWRRSLSYRTQSIDLPCKSMDWFLYGRDFRHESVKSHAHNSISQQRCSMKKPVVKNLGRFTGKNTRVGVSFAGLQHRCYLVDLAKFLRTSTLKNTWKTAASVLYKFGCQSSVPSNFCPSTQKNRRICV